MKILIVDDEPDIRRILQLTLRSHGYDVVEATNGKEALAVFDESFSLILLDIMMDNIDGIETCSMIRKKSSVPIIFLTAKTSDLDKLEGFSHGADDYISKPFNPMEVVARIKAVLRRSSVITVENPKLSLDMDKKKHVIKVKDLLIDEGSYRLFRGDEEIHLTKTEFLLLLALAKNRGQIFNSQRLLEVVWGDKMYMSCDNTIAVHIKKIREKLGDSKKEPLYIKTIWGIGYRLD